MSPLLLSIVQQHSLSTLPCRNCSVRSEAVERRVVDLDVCPLLLSILDSPHWPNCLRDVAGGLLQSLAERWDNVQAMTGLRYSACIGSKQSSRLHNVLSTAPDLGASHDLP